MIKIDKNLNDIPDSLQLPKQGLFSNGRVPRPARTTHQRRLELIAAGEYIDEANYHTRYKQEDTQAKLRGLYKNKCAFCEQKVEQSHIEHYRPKSIYYWLAYSWDNLLIACTTCNVGKLNNFDLDGTKANFSNSAEEMADIHKSGNSYDTAELPRMVNPEVTDPSGYLNFQTDGKISSDEPRFAYTIDKCSIDRKYLNDERRKLLSDLESDMRSALVDNPTPEAQRVALATITRKFIRDSKNSENTFLAFRRFAISESWMNIILKSLN